MNWYKKFNNYLLTHQPLLWHSRVIQLSAIMIALNLLFYVVGYYTVNLKKMRVDWNVESWFFRDTYSLFWICSGLIILIVWATFFYRNNAAKNFYPISKWYFHKLAIFIFIPVFLFFLTPFSFFSGVSKTAKKIISKQELFELYSVSRFTQPFLLFVNDNFDYTARKYPQVYENIRYYVQSPDNSNPYFYYGDGEKQISTILASIRATPIDSIQMIFAYKRRYKEMNYIRGKDTCSHRTEEFAHVLTKDSLPDFSLNHIKNFDPIATWGYNSLMFGDLTDLDTLKTRFKPSDLYSSNYLALIHDWIDNRPEEILKTLEEFKVLLTKYGIGNSIRPKKTYAYLLKNDFRADRELTQSIYDDYYDETSLDRGIKETVDTIIREDNGQEEEYWTQSMLDNHLNTLIENAFAVNEMNYFYDYFLLKIFGFLTLGITMLLLYFQWGSVISLVISIPIAGVFFFLGALLYIMIRRPWMYENTSNFPVEIFVYLLLYASVLLISILGLKRVWNSYVTNIALTISYFLAPLLLTMLTFFAHAIFTTDELLRCQEFPSRVEPFSLDYGWAPFILMYSPYPIFWIFIFFLKTIIAKKEG